MPIKWKSQRRFKPSVLLGRISKVRTVNDDGSVSFTSFEFSQHEAALFSMLDFPDVASDMNKEGLVRSALFSVNSELTPESFIGSINARLEMELSKVEKEYCFLTSMSISAEGLPKTIIVDGVKVMFFGNEFPKKYKDRGAFIEKYRKSTGIPLSPDSYCAVGACVSAKSEEVAVNRALRALDLLRGIMCIHGNPQFQLTFGGTDRSPINVIRFGSIQTLHAKDGAPVGDFFWYEPDYKEARIFKFKKIDVVKKNIRKSLIMISRSRFGRSIADSAIRYVRALDEPNSSVAFLRLWGALEMLLTPGKADYDLLIERCSFLFVDREYVRQVMMHLRERRNATVHTGHDVSEARTNCYILQMYFVDVFLFFLLNSRDYRSLVEIHELLDMPRSKDEISRRRKILRHATKFCQN